MRSAKRVRQSALDEGLRSDGLTSTGVFARLRSPGARAKAKGTDPIDGEQATGVAALPHSNSMMQRSHFQPQCGTGPGFAVDS